MIFWALVLCFLLTAVGKAEQSGVWVVNARHISNDGAHVRALRTDLNAIVDPEMSGTPLYLQNRIIHSPGFKEGDNDSCMFDTTKTTKYFTRISREVNETVTFGSGWHSDLTFYKTTPHLSTIMGIDLYNDKTYTLFKDMRHVLNDWNKVEGNESLEGLYANHTDNFNYWAVHPVVRTDVVGSPALFVNRAFTRSLVGGHEDDNLLDRLLDFIDNHKESEFEQEWGMGDMLIWDNTYLQHSAPPFDWNKNPSDHRREIRRVVTTGWVPI